MIGDLLALLVLAIVAGLLIAPLESLGWYAGWFGVADAHAQGKTAAPAQSPSVQLNAPDDGAERHFLVYLSGVGALDPSTVPDEEYPLIAALGDQLHKTTILADIFPYAPENRGLTGQRTAAFIWRALNRLRLRHPNAALAYLINLRNLFQVLVSADQRYGPIANLGVARSISGALVAAGYQVGGGAPITVVGFSGGGQIAVGAASYLKLLMGAPIYVISVGGVISSDPGLDEIERLWHLYGSRDRVQSLGGVVFPGRWPLMRKSAWNRALGEGRISMIEIGPYQHNVHRHYFDTESRLPSGRTYRDHVADEICRVVAEAGLDGR